MVIILKYMIVVGTRGHVPGERSKIEKYFRQNGKQGNKETENVNRKKSGNSRVFGNMGNFPPILGNPVPQEYAAKVQVTSVG